MRVFILYFIGVSLFAEARNTFLNSWLCLWKASQKPRLSLTARTNVTFAGWNGAHWPFPPGSASFPCLSSRVIEALQMQMWHYCMAAFQLGRVLFWVKGLVAVDEILWRAGVFHWQGATFSLLPLMLKVEFSLQLSHSQASEFSSSVVTCSWWWNPTGPTFDADGQTGRQLVLLFQSGQRWEVCRV